MTDPQPQLLTDRLEDADYRRVRPNPWNPNVESAFIYERVKRSVATYGMVTPPVVSPIAGEDPDYDYEIVNGEHRHRAWLDLGRDHGPLDLITDHDGARPPDHVLQRLTLLLNAQGENDEIRLAELISDLAAVPGIDLAEELPFTMAELEHLATIVDLDLSGGDIAGGVGGDGDGEGPTTGGPGERWVKLEFELPRSASSVVIAAMNAAKDDPAQADWQGLERIAAEFMAGYTPAAHKESHQ